MKKSIFLIFLLSLAGCARMIQPQSFIPQTSDINQAAVVLNNYVENDFYYIVKSFDKNKVGDSAMGSARINEIYAGNGSHTLEITANFSSKSMWANAYQKTFNGSIKCDLKSGNFYTIAPNPNGTAVDESWANYIPTILVGQLLAGDKIVDVKGNLKLACIEHSTKPVNTSLENTAKTYGWKIVPEFYNPNAK